MNKTNLLFCIGLVAGSLAIFFLAFPFAAMAPEKVAFANTPQPAENMTSVNVGEGFGTVSVSELMDYYIQNPPAPPEPGAVMAPKIRMGGC